MRVFVAESLLALTAGVTVLSNNPAMTAGRMELQLLPHQVAEAAGVQVGATADHAVPG